MMLSHDFHLIKPDNLEKSFSNTTIGIVAQRKQEILKVIANPCFHHLF